MKSTIFARITLFGLTILILQQTILCYLPELRALGIRPRDAYVTLGTAVVLIPSCIIWSNKHHPAALAAKQFDAQREEGRRLAREAQAFEDQRKLIREQKLKAERLLQHIKHIYEPELNLLPNNQIVTQKTAFVHIIKSNHNTQQTPLTYYYQKQKIDLEELRKIDPNLLDTEKKTDLSQLIRNMERVHQSFNLVLADAQKAEQETAKIEKRKEDAEKRKIEKENLEIQKTRLKIENYHETEKNNSHIRSELHRANERLDAVNNKLHNTEMSQISRAQQFEQNIVTQIKTAIATQQDAITKTINGHTQVSDAATKELTKMLNEFKKFLENIGALIAIPRPPPYNPEALQAAPAATYS